MSEEKEAKQIATKRNQLQREQSIRTQKHITLDEIGRRLAIGDFKELNIFNTSRYFTRSKPSIKKYEEEKYESKLFLDDNVNRKDFGGLRYKDFYTGTPP